MLWNSLQYLKFQNERTQPSIDLVNRINHENPETIIDIGCGPANSTNILAEKYPNAKILGIDNSQEMINTARDNYRDLEFELCDASKDLNRINRKFDVVFSNACIQWIPDHHTLLKNMMSLLNEQGVMAVQTPMNYEEPIHQIIGEITKSEKWCKKFNNPRIFYNLTQNEYFDILSNISSNFTMWQTTYFHKMKSHEDIMEWYKGTGLRPYLSVLSDVDKMKFENDVFNEVVKAYPRQSNGEVIFRFPRFFFIAIKK